MPDPQTVSFAGSAVATLSRAQAAAVRRWRHLTDLLGSTLQMRESDYHQEWLPPQPKEKDTQYRNRLNRSFLYPAFRDTVDKLSARPFSHRTVELLNDENLDPRLAKIEANVDKAGKDLTQFAKAWLRDSMVRGVSFCLVDFPATGGAQTLEDELVNGVWPTWVHIKAASIISIRFGKAEATGQHYLKQLRYKFSTDEPDGDFAEESVDRIRVWEAPDMDQFGRPMLLDDGRGWAKGTFQTWRQIKDGWVPEGDPIIHSYPGIPLVPNYTAQTGYFSAEPPFDDLGWLNIAHWQSSSDQRNILSHARVPMRFEFGVEDDQEEIENGPARTIGPAEVVQSKNPDAKAGFIEHTGAGIDAGQNDIDKLEERMQALGGAPLVERVSTATEVRINKGESMTVMQSWIRGIEKAIHESYLVSARWIEWAEAERQNRPPKPDSELLPEDFAADVFSDFATAEGDAKQAEMILKARLAGEITSTRFTTEWKAMGVLSENMDIDAEAAELANESMLSIPVVDVGAGDGQVEE